LPLDSDQAVSFYERLSDLWVETRDDLGVESAQEQAFHLALSRREVVCVRQCLLGVLRECTGNPLELELRVGMPNKIKELLSRFNELLAVP
jgi:hypothetical protein